MWDEALPQATQPLALFTVKLGAKPQNKHWQKAAMGENGKLSQHTQNNYTWVCL